MNVLCPDWPVPAIDGYPITGCGRMTPDVRDDEGWVDCQHCGMFFNPDHEENQPRDTDLSY
jgi:hypothetical protein